MLINKFINGLISGHKAYPVNLIVCVLLYLLLEFQGFYLA